MGVILTGHINVPKERRVEVAAALVDHVRLTRAEPGCVYFNVTPDPDVPGRYSVSERFENRAAFDAHQQRAAASHWGKVSAGLPRDYEISEDDA